MDNQNNNQGFKAFLKETGIEESATKKETDVVKMAAYVVLGVVFIPIIVNTGKGLINGGINLVNQMKHKRKIKKGLKNGSIIEVDGQYYEVKVGKSNEAE